MIRSLRILPPLAFARVGSGSEPVASYTTRPDDANQLGLRLIEPEETLVVAANGEVRSETPRRISFSDGDRLRPVAPFFEVFADVGAPDEQLVPLDHGLLAEHGELQWTVTVANRKVFRRTGDPNDIVQACVDWWNDREKHRLEGRCPYFVNDACIPLGEVQYLAPTGAMPQARLRFTPPRGLIYGPRGRHENILPAARQIYDADRGHWYGFGQDKPLNDTMPPSLFANQKLIPVWLNDGEAISRGYFDDICDGFINVRLKCRNGQVLNAMARICVAPPVIVPDASFVRTLADDLEQVLHGPAIQNEPLPVTRWRTQDIIRRASETLRFLNVALMNGNAFKGRNPLLLDSMPEEEAFDTGRQMRPIFAPQSVDTLAVLALHQQIFTALRAGLAPWFLRHVRQPEDVTDFTDLGRRKMPALMCGADNAYLALTHRQIDAIRISSTHPPGPSEPPAPVTADQLTPLNLSAQLFYRPKGNPISTTPATSVANCCPGLEVDFRAVWRRLFKGIVLREYDNWVVDIDPAETDPDKRALKGHRLLRVNGFPVVTTKKGPSVDNPTDPTDSSTLSTKDNHDAVASLEWSNALAKIVHVKTVTCEFSAQPTDGNTQLPANALCLPPLTFAVRPFFVDDVVISPDLAQAGELTQGLCSPWQNDYRECSCYYWASARPDYVNIEPSPTGASVGDNWLQKQHGTKDYVPDDYKDRRLVLYQDLFEDWERWVRVQIGGKDAAE